MADIFDQAAAAPASSTGDVFDQATAPTAPISKPPVNPEFNMPAAAARSFGITDLIDSAKQSWAAGQSTRDAEMKVAKDVTDLVKKGDFGTAAETLLSHLYHGAVDTTKQQIQQGGNDLVSTAKGIYRSATTPAAEGQVLGTPITPMPGISGALEDFADSEAAIPATSTAESSGIVQQVIKGKGVAQSPAQEAIRSSVGAESETPILKGDTTIIDEPLDALGQAKTDAYAKMDKAAGFDVKAEETQLQNDLYKRQQLGNTAADQTARVKLDEAINDSQKRLADAQSKMSAAGIDPNEAKTLNTQWKAGQDIKKTIIQNTSADGSTVKVDGLLNGLKKLQFSKYGNRVEQFFGSDAGNKLMSDLMQAQKLGMSAMKVQKIAKIVAAAIGIGALGKGVSTVASISGH